MKSTLKLFVVADVNSPDSFNMPELAPADADLVLTLGDIDPDTLDYIHCRSGRVPVFGVLGNHDPESVAGFKCLHLSCVTVKGVNIGGFNGARKYKDHPNHFTDDAVWKMMEKMPPVDLFVSHAPPYVTSQDENRTHQGFPAFDRYIQESKPQHWFHGHIEKNYTQQVGPTAVHGVSGKSYFELEFNIANWI